MSHVADHTALIQFAETPIYAHILLADYAQGHGYLAVPTISLMTATRMAVTNSAELAELVSRRVVVKAVELDVDAAYTVGFNVPVVGSRELWPLIAPVVWIAKSLNLAVLTRRPDLYDGYAVRIAQMP
ncbi:hypothetical protein [Nocardia sp. CA-120079]|uniref:hypothetical protein n=1 Tax=Nocardia sp. CA-120079 TaxID=3239974 RepID=UPI003D98E238